MWVWIAIGLMLAGLAYVRFAPADVDRWHQMPPVEEGVGDYRGKGRFLAVRNVDAEAFQRLVASAEGWPRTRVIAGRADQGMITFETRSRIIGFPDYTTLRFADGRLEVLARLRFGLEDFGVNRARVEAWFEAAGIE